MASRKSSKGSTTSRTSRNSRLSNNSSEKQSSGPGHPVFKYSAKQRKTWKPLNKQLKAHILNLIDSNVKSVCSKPQFSDNTEVQQILTDLKTRMKVQIEDCRVPNKQYGDPSRLKKLLEELSAELEGLTTQQLLLEKSIRTEERKIEELENLQETIQEPLTLKIKIPSSVLDLPCIPT